MLTFPKYQPIYFENIPTCGSCDKITIPRGNLNIQANKNEVNTPELFLNGNFDTNPFSPITSTDLVFNFNWGVDLIPYNSYFTLYIANKAYIFKFIENTNNTPFYTTVISGNVTIIDIHIAFDLLGTKISPIAIASRLQSVLQQIVDVNHGTTSTINGTYPFQITIANIPSGSYLDDIPYSILTNISTVGASINGIYLLNGFYNSTTKQINYYPIDISNSVAMIFKSNVYLENGKTYKINYGYATIDNFSFVQLLGDSSNNLVYISGLINPLPVSFAGLNRTEIFNCTLDDTYTMHFIFTPTNTSNQLAFDNISVKEFIYCEITDVILVIDGNTEYTITNTYYTIQIVNNNYILQIDLDNLFTVLFDDVDVDFTSKCFQIKLKDCDDNEFVSNIFNSVDPNNLSCGFKKIRLTWYNKCSFAGNEYPLGVMNDVYVNGFVKRTPGDKKSRTVFTSTEGKVSLAYNYSVDKYTLKIVNYTENTHNFIERAILHSNFYINDVKYTINESSSYDYGRSNSDRFTADVNLIKDGSELIVIDCCN